MAKRKHSTTPQPEPAVLPDVASQPHPGGPSSPPVPPAGPDQLQKVLPEINEVAQKVGGFKKLSEIADTLDQAKE